MGLYYQKILTEKLSPVISFLGIDKISKPIYSGKGQILMFHRVIPKEAKVRIHNHLSLEIAPEHLQFIIQFFQKQKYDFINLDELPHWLVANEGNNKKFVVFTFDDGYKDNLTFAYPIFKKYQIPFTIYVTNSFPDGSANFWWYLLEKVVINNNKIRYSFSKDTIDLDCYGLIKKESAFNRIRQIIMGLDEKSRDIELQDFFSGFELNEIVKKELFSLSWSEITELSCDSLVTIGAHTLSHYNLCSLSDEQAYLEVNNSKVKIESMINKKVNHFSYPLGKYGPREIDLVKSSGFITATTTRTANTFYDHVSHLHTLPRITINTLTTEKVLKLQINGFYPAIVNSFRKIVI